MKKIKHYKRNCYWQSSDIRKKSKLKTNFQRAINIAFLVVALFSSIIYIAIVGSIISQILLIILTLLIPIYLEYLFNHQMNIHNFKKCLKIMNKYTYAEFNFYYDFFASEYIPYTLFVPINFLSHRRKSEIKYSSEKISILKYAFYADIKMEIFEVGCKCLFANTICIVDNRFCFYKSNDSYIMRDLMIKDDAKHFESVGDFLYVLFRKLGGLYIN